MKKEKIPNLAIKAKKILFTMSTSKYLSPYLVWSFPLKRLFKQIIFFDTHLNKIRYGKKIMNTKFIEFVKREKPDYILMSFGADEFYLDTFLKLRVVSPKTKIFGSFADDDMQFEQYSRYIMLFLDYGLIHQNNYISKYKKDGINDVFDVIGGLDNKFFRPLNLEKKYDITFIGLPLSDKSLRYEYIKFLKNKGVKIKLFGWAWDKYPEFKDIYSGPLESKEMIKILNQSKINLCFSRNVYGEPHLKGKVFEGGACKTFVLTEYCKDYLELFKEGKEIIMFKGEDDLLKKIDYYLKNEKEREKIANLAYKKIMEKYNLEEQLKNIFKEISKKEKKHRELPKLNKKVFSFSKKDFNRNKNELANLLNKYDYVTFVRKNCENLKYKEFLQVYSLMKTNKPISCCNYYVHRKNLGDYLYFCTKKAFRDLDKEDFISFLDLSQILVTKKFFLDNLEQFKESFYGKIDFLNTGNTAFVGFPLVRIKKIPRKKYSVMKKAFIFEFFHQLYSLYYTKKIFYKPYIPSLLLEALSGKFFIFSYLFDAVKDKSRLKRLRIYQDSSKF